MWVLVQVQAAPLEIQLWESRGKAKAVGHCTRIGGSRKLLPSAGRHQLGSEPVSPCLRNFAFQLLKENLQELYNTPKHMPSVAQGKLLQWPACLTSISGTAWAGMELAQKSLCTSR